MEEAIVLYSTPEHLNSLSLLAPFIAKHYPSISVVVISTAAALPPLSAAPSVTFHRLPVPALPPNATFTPVELFFEIPRFNNPNLRRALAEISRKSKIRAIVLDFFCNYAFEVAESLGIPTFYYTASGASGFCALIYWTTIHEESGGKIDGAADVPGCPLIPAADLPEMMHFPESLGYRQFLETAVNVQRSGGMIVNSFYALEVRAMEALRNGLCTPGAPPTPVYALGPLINPLTGKQNDAVLEHDCLRWLDSQPSKSVIFLCFGRRGAFSAEQLKETAVGLENSGYRFLWAVRAPPGKAAAAAEEPDLEALLPEGFLERTRERGLVLKSWAPQTEVLSHESVGGFVTHCGQSSMLEAVSFGVPMIGWPLYAEQKMNRLFMVEEMKVGLHLEATEKGFVTAAELEKRIRELMESIKGREVRRRVTEMKFTTAAAVRKGGSSVVALEKFMAATLTPV